MAAKTVRNQAEAAEVAPVTTPVVTISPVGTGGAGTGKKGLIRVAVNGKHIGNIREKAAGSLYRVGMGEGAILFQGTALEAAQKLAALTTAKAEAAKAAKAEAKAKAKAEPVSESVSES